MSDTMTSWVFSDTVDILRGKRYSSTKDEKVILKNHCDLQLSRMLDKFIPGCSEWTGDCCTKKRYILKDLGMINDNDIPENQGPYRYDHIAFRKHIAAKLPKIREESIAECDKFKAPTDPRDIRDYHTCMRVANNLIDFMKNIAQVK